MSMGSSSTTSPELAPAQAYVQQLIGENLTNRLKPGQKYLRQVDTIQQRQDRIRQQIKQIQASPQLTAKQKKNQISQLEARLTHQDKAIGTQKDLAQQQSAKIRERELGQAEQSVAPLVGEYDQLREVLGGMDLSQLAQPSQQAQSALSQALSGESSYDLDPAMREQWWRDAVVAPAMDVFENEVNPQIGAELAGLGATFSSRRGNIQANALNRLQTTTTGALAEGRMFDEQLRAQLAESAAGRQLGAVGLESQLKTQGLGNLAGYAGLLSPFQDFEQRLASARYEEQMRQRFSTSPLTQLAMQYVGGLPSGQTTQTSSGTPWGSIAGAGVGGLAALFSAGATLPMSGIFGGLGSAFNTMTPSNLGGRQGTL